MFHSLCELAFFGLLEDRILFSKEELNLIPDTLSLLYGTKVHDEAGPKTRYSFLHQTIQELLAAIHMSRMPHDDQLSYFQNLCAQERIYALIQFYAGITSLQFVETVSILVENIISSKETLNEHDIIHAYFKSQNVKEYILNHLAIQEEVNEKSVQDWFGNQPSETTSEASLLNGMQGNDNSVDRIDKVSEY